MSARILLVGYGNMGQALAGGWLAAGRSPSDIAVLDPSTDAQRTARAAGLAVVDDALEAAVVVVAVKPAQLESTRSLLEATDGLLLSIVAGMTLADLAAVAGAERPIVRAMPNTPAAIRRGMTVLCANDRVDESGRARCEDLMAAVGDVAWIEDEALMDAVTAVSGSGPAYVFLLIECLIDAARSLGIDADLAAQLAAATVAGSGLYAGAADVPASELRQRVTSPGGTTEAALAVLLEGDQFKRLMSAAVEAATLRSRELSHKD